MDSGYIVAGIIVASVMTYITRAIPFLFFRKKEPSDTIKYIEWNMPVMIMVILIFYALKDVSWGVYPYGISEIIGIVIAGSLHIKYKNALLSISVATAVYMFLVQKIVV